MKILVIDDDPEMTELLKLLLRPTQSEVITANSGMDGVELARHEHPDMIILDLMMAEMDGFQVCEVIRKFCDCPIMILSALDNPAVVAKALDAGADDYLVKPVPSVVLIAHINTLFRRSHAQSGILMSTQHP